MNTLEGRKTKSPFGNAIQADSTGALPQRIELLKAGIWRTPYHGDFMITPDDLQEYVDNFTAGYGLADGGSAGAPIDFSHNNEAKAAGWITSLETDGTTLFGNVKWSQAGKDAILGDEFKFFSPEFYPKGRGGWMDPEDYEHVIDNVLTGGGLTNIPLFKTLGALKASAGGRQEYRTSEVYINASELTEKENPMTIEELRKIQASELSEEQKQFVVDHQAELSDEDKVHFGLTGGLTASVDKAIEDKNKENHMELDDETRQIAADIKAGKSVVISASAYEKMQNERKADREAVEKLTRESVTASVEAHVARGAIKADQIVKWVDRIMKDESLSEDLANLPSNEILADSKGSSLNAGDATVAAETELHDKVVAFVKAAAEQGKDVSYVNARNEVLAANPEIKKNING